MNVQFDELKNEIKRVFVKRGMSEKKAETCARVHAESSYDGIYSHGTNRVPRFADYLEKGWVDPDAEPTVEKSLGAVCVLNGHLGPGILNALAATDKAMDLAREYGIGMVGLRNTTHWMRGGTYGLYAAERGFVAIMWTNTESCMPPWGGKTCAMGNNPFVMAAPGDPHPIMLDMAMSLYAYGKLEVIRQAGKKLPFPGGFDSDGTLTDDPAAIEKSRRILPMGYWKGSSFAFMLDILGAVLSDGIGTSDIDNSGTGSCGGASQVFIVIDPTKLVESNRLREIIQKEIDHIKSAERAEGSTGITAPGEGRIAFRTKHDREGIHVDDAIWSAIKAL